MEENRVGRPSSHHIKIFKGFRIREDLAKNLETYPNQTTVIEEALEYYFDIDGKSQQWINKRLLEIEREKKSLESLKLKKEKEIKENEIKETKLQQRYDDFVKYLLDPDTVYNTKRLNERFNTTIRNFKHFEELQQKNKDNNFSIDDFKLILKDRELK